MLDLRNLFKNFFNTNRISDDTLRRGAQDHLARLQANNQRGQYQQLVADTQADFDAYCQAIDSEDNNFATQQGATKVVDQIIDKFKKDVSRYEGLVRGYFGTDSKEYQEFFPQGLSEFGAANKSNIEMLMDRMMRKTDEHSPTLGGNIKAIFEQHKQTYLSARTNQLQNIAGTTVRKTNTANARERLEIRLCKNLLAIALEHVGNPEILANYLDQSIFRGKTAKDDGSVEETIAPNAVVNLEDRGIKDTTEIQIKNTGETLLHVGLYPTNDKVDTAKGVQLLPRQSKTIIAKTLGEVDGMYLNVKNLSTDANGVCEVLIL